jgi:hypothetical protein
MNELKHTVEVLNKHLIAYQNMFSQDELVKLHEYLKEHSSTNIMLEAVNDVEARNILAGGIKGAEDTFAKQPQASCLVLKYHCLLLIRVALMMFRYTDFAIDNQQASSIVLSAVDAASHYWSEPSEIWPFSRTES